MIFQLFAMIIIDAAILSGVLRMLAKHEADCSFAKCAMVVAPIVVAPLVLLFLLTEHLSAPLVLIAVPLLLIPFAVFMVSKFCWVPWPKAILVVIVFAVGHLILNLGIAAARRQFQKAIGVDAPSRPAKVSRTAPATQPAAELAQPAPSLERPEPSRRAPSPRDRLLTEAGERMAGRLSVGGQLAALAKAVGTADGVMLESASFRCTSSGSDWDATLKIAVRIPTAGEKAVQGLLDHLKKAPAFLPPWRVAVSAFAADTSPGASREARTAVMECVLRAPRGRPTAGADWSGDDVRFVQANVLAPAHGNYLFPATEIVKKAASVVRLVPESVKEIGTFASPGGEGAPALENYAVRVSGPWKLADAARLAGTIEGNHLLQIQAIDVRCQQGTGRTSASINVAWPVWCEPEKAEAILQGADRDEPKE